MIVIQLIADTWRYRMDTPATWWETTQDKEPIEYLIAHSYFVTLRLGSCLYCVKSWFFSLQWRPEARLRFLFHTLKVKIVKSPSLFLDWGVGIHGTLDTNPFHPHHRPYYSNPHPLPLLTPSGGHQNTYGLQVGGTHRTWMLSCWYKWYNV